MKILLILCILILNLLGDGFKYYININENMTNVEITNIIQDAQDGTVILFEEGKYAFYKTITLKEKSHIAIQGENFKKTIISGLSLIIENSNDIHIKSFTYKDKSLIKFIDSKNIFINNLSLEKTQIGLYSSTASINDIASLTDYKFPILYIDNSTVKINNVYLGNNLASTINIGNQSKVQVLNSTISSSKIAFLINDSSLHIVKNNFINTNDAIKKSEFINMNHSNLIAIENNFENNEVAIGLFNSTGYIEKNTFEKIAYYLFLSNSSANINTNYLKNAIGTYSYGIRLENSKANISKNDFFKLHFAILLDRHSQANINQNKIGSLIREYYTDKEGSQKFYKGLGINISKNCFANITTNTAYNLEYHRIGIAREGSKVYAQNNDEGFYYPTWSENQKSNKQLIIDVNSVKDFRNIFDTIKISNIDYKQLQIYKPKKKIIKVPNMIKGYLNKEIIVDCDEYEEVIEVGTWIVFNTDNNTLIEPSEYNGKCLDEKPQLNINAEQRKIKIFPTVSNPSTNVFLLSFTIKSNVKFTNINLNDKRMKFKNSNNKLITKPRRIKNFNKVYTLKLSNSKFEEYYNCIFNDDKEVKCTKKIQEEL